MSKQTQLAVLGAAVMLAAGSVAAEPWKSVGGEAGWVLGPPVAAVAPATSPATLRAGDATADGIQFVGGEAVWTRASHKYDLKGGSFIHAHQAWCVASHDLPAAAKPTAKEMDALRVQYGGGA